MLGQQAIVARCGYDALQVMNTILGGSNGCFVVRG